MHTSDIKLSRMKDKTPVAVTARCTATDSDMASCCSVESD